MPHHASTCCCVASGLKQASNSNSRCRALMTSFTSSKPSKGTVMQLLLPLLPGPLPGDFCCTGRTRHITRMLPLSTCKKPNPRQLTPPSSSVQVMASRIAHQLRAIQPDTLLHFSTNPCSNLMQACTPQLVRSTSSLTCSCSCRRRLTALSRMNFSWNSAADAADSAAAAVAAASCCCRWLTCCICCSSLSRSSSACKHNTKQLLTQLGLWCACRCELEPPRSTQWYHCNTAVAHDNHA